VASHQRSLTAESSKLQKTKLAKLEKNHTENLQKKTTEWEKRKKNFAHEHEKALLELKNTHKAEIGGLETQWDHAREVLEAEVAAAKNLVRDGMTRVQKLEQEIEVSNVLLTKTEKASSNEKKALAKKTRGSGNSYETHVFVMLLLWLVSALILYVRQ